MNPYSSAKKIHGPYTRKDGRQHVIVVWLDGSKQTVSYPKYLMEVELDRFLTEEENVDHVNEDFIDNRLENLQILTRSENSKKHFQSLTSEEKDRRSGKGVEYGWTHGTIYGFMTKRCTCAKCQSRREEHNRKRRENSLGSRGPRKPYSRNPSHGTTARYKKGCDCSECRAANAEASRLRQRRRRRKVDPDGDVAE